MATKWRGFSFGSQRTGKPLTSNSGYLAHRKEHPFTKYSLFIPLFLGGALIYVSYKGMEQSLTLQVKVNAVVKDLAMQGAPPVDILRQSLLILGILDVIVCYCLFLLIFCSCLIFGEEG